MTARMIIRPLTKLLVAGVALAMATLASAQTYSGPLYDSLAFGFYLNDSAELGNSGTQIGGNVEVTANPAALTLTYDALSLKFPENLPSESGSISVPTAGGTTDKFSASVILTSISLSLVSPTTTALGQPSENVYPLSAPPAYTSITITGSYIVSDANAEATGSFSLTLPYESGSLFNGFQSFGPGYGAALQGYPDQMEYGSSTPPALFVGTLDGQAIDLTLGQVAVKTQGGDVLSLVPEPAFSATGMALATLILILIGRKNSLRIG